MKSAHRKVHRFVWILLVPLLLLAILIFSESDFDTMPPQSTVPGLSDTTQNALTHRVLP